MGAPEDFEGLEAATGLTSRTLTQSLLMGTIHLSIPPEPSSSPWNPLPVFPFTAIPDCSSTAAFVRTTGVDNEEIKADAGSRWAPCREEMSHRAGCGERVCSSARTFVEKCKISAIMKSRQHRKAGK